jgi:outer membrane protein assembly factor BamB
VPVPPDGVFLSKGYGEGSALIQLLPGEEDTFQVREVWHNRRVLRTKFSNVALLDGFLYGLSQGILECVDVRTGDRVWKTGRYGHGQMLLVDRTLLILTEEGELVHVEATPDRPNRVLGRLQALEGPTWNNFALYGAYVVLRNAREAAVYRLPLQG